MNKVIAKSVDIGEVIIIYNSNKQEPKLNCENTQNISLFNENRTDV